ncbi:MAG: hypothetical protein R2795_16505 [Saprospiraceae bacterium]
MLSVTSFLVPALAVLALNELLNSKIDKPRAIRSLAIGGGISLAIALFFALLGPSMFTLTMMQMRLPQPNVWRPTDTRHAQCRAQWAGRY